MAPLIAFMLEAAELVDHNESNTTTCAAGPSSATAQRKAGDAPYGARCAAREAIAAAADWDMCTLAVYTCSKSCSGAACTTGNGEGHIGGVLQAHLAEEHLELMNETDCHLPMPR